MLNEKEEQELFEAFLQEASENRDMPIVLQLSIDDVLALVPALQLALRHPGFTGPSSLVTRRVITQVIEGFKIRELNKIAAALELGNDPANDVLQ